MKTNSKIKIRFGLLLFVALSAAGTARAATRDVCGGCTYTTIQAAVNAAANGDIIELRANFAENVSVDGKTLTFQSDATRRTWDGANNGTPTLIIRNGMTATINDLTMNHSSGSGGYVIDIQTNGTPKLIVQNSTMMRTSGSTTNPYIIRSDSASNGSTSVTILESEFIGNASSSGIWATNAQQPLVDIQNSTFGCFSGPSSVALYVNGNGGSVNSRSPYLVNNTFYSNTVAYQNDVNTTNTCGGSCGYIQNNLFLNNGTDVDWPPQLTTEVNMRTHFTYNIFSQQTNTGGWPAGNVFGAIPNDVVNSVACGSEDLMIKSTGPAYNTGLGSNATGSDIVGNPANGVRDIGAYEFVGPLPTATPSITPTFTQTPLPTFTQTPGLLLVKSSNVAVASVGDTITFCIDWVNDSNGPYTHTFYDNLAPEYTYLGADSGCSVAGQLVTCSFPTSAGSSGTKCIWVEVTSMP